MRSRVWVSFCLVFGIAGLAFFATACGSSNKAHLRLVNAMVTQSNLDMLIDGTNVASNVGYATASNYISVSSGSRHVQVEPAGSSSPVIDTTASVNSGDNVTALAYLNTSNANSSAFLVDNNSAPSSGNFNLRVINASPAMGASVDVYIEPVGTAPTGTPTNLADGSASGYVGLSTNNTWHVIFTVTNSPNQVLLDTGAISSATAGQIWTVIGLNATQGGFSFAALHDAG
jgi:Domain of unknown function (DUF4397)